LFFNRNQLSKIGIKGEAFNKFYDSTWGIRNRLLLDYFFYTYTWL